MCTKSEIDRELWNFEKTLFSSISGLKYWQTILLSQSTFLRYEGHQDFLNYLNNNFLNIYKEENDKFKNLSQRTVNRNKLMIF